MKKQLTQRICMFMLSVVFVIGMISIPTLAEEADGQLAGELETAITEEPANPGDGKENAEQSKPEGSDEKENTTDTEKTAPTKTEKKEIKEVTVSAVTVEYSEDKKGNPVAVDIVNITGLKKDDTVTFTINKEKPHTLTVKNVKTEENDKKESVTYVDQESKEWTLKRSDIGTYEVQVKVERKGYISDEQKVTSEIVKGKLKGIEVTPTDETYDPNNGETRPVAKITGRKDGDKTKYVLKEKNSEQEKTIDTTLNKKGEEKSAPTIKNAVGTYTLKVVVERGNYEYVAENLEVKIKEAELDASTFEVKPYAGGAYDEKEHAILEKTDKDVLIKGMEQGDKAKYQLLTGDAEKIEENWKVIDPTSVPTVKEAGTYKLYLRIERANYKPVELKEQTITIEEAELDASAFEVTPYAGGTYDGEEHAVLEKNGKDVLIKGMKKGDKVEYQLLTEGAEKTEENWKAIDPTSVPKVKDAGTYKLYLRIERANYKPVELEQNIIINKAQAKLAFDNDNVEKGENDNWVATVEFDENNKEFDFSVKAESIQGEDPKPVKIENSTIEYQVENEVDKENPIAEINEEGHLIVKKGGNLKVTATLKDKNYEETSIFCNVTIKDNSKDLLSFEKESVEYIVGANEGTVSDLQAKQKYGEGQEKITYTVDNAEKLGLTIDEGGKLTVQNADYKKIVDELTNKANNKEELSITVTVTAIIEATENHKEGKASYTVNIKYAEPIRDAYSLQYEEAGKFIPAVSINGWYNKEIFIVPASGYQIASIDSKKITKEDFKENLSATNTESQEKESQYYYLRNKKTGGILAPITVEIGKLDKTAPEAISIEYSDNTVVPEFDNTKFYHDDVTITFKATDKLSGVNQFEWSYAKANNTTEKADAEGVIKEKELEKVTNEAGEVTYKGTITLPTAEMKGLKGSISVVAVDNAGNKAEAYKDGKTIIVDKTPPKEEVKFKYKNSKEELFNENSLYYVNGDLECHFYVTEDNFYQEDVLIRVSENGQDFAVIPQEKLTWKPVEGSKNKYLATYTLSEEKTYVVELLYIDRLANPARKDVETVKVTVDKSEKNAQVAYRSKEIMVDKTAPKIENINITYDSTSHHRVKNGIKYADGNVTANVSIKEKNFDSKDIEAQLVQNGKEYTIGNWTLDNSTEHVYKGYCKIPYSKDHDYDGVYTLKIKYTDKGGNPLHDTNDEELYEKNGNVTDQYTEDKIIIIDTTKPELTKKVNFSNATKTGNKWYAKKTVDATFTIKEKNFDASEVNVVWTKDNKKIDTIETKWTNNSDNHTATCTIPANDGEYQVNIEYKDYCDNEMTKYTSDVLVIDTIKPVINVTYPKAINTQKDAEKHTRSYYNGTVTAKVSVKEKNFNGVVPKVVAKNIKGENVNGSKYKLGDWNHNGENHTMNITYSTDANYTFDVECEDLAGNKADKYPTAYFTVDKTAPTGLKIEYSGDAKKGGSIQYYKNPVTVKLIAHDSIAKVTSMKYEGTKASGSSSNNIPSKNIGEGSIKYDNGGEKATANFTISAPFNGNVSFTATDRSKNESSKFKDNTRIVVDNTKPEGKITYNKAKKTVGKTSYYDGSIKATITMKEANFFAEDVKVTVTQDGKSRSVKPKWSGSNDNHTGTFELSGDGTYTVSMSYTDRSGNAMTNYKSEKMIVDTKINKPVVLINGKQGDRKAFKDTIVPSVRFEDKNFDSYKITLTRTRYDKKNEDVTKKFIGNRVKTTTTGGSGTFDTFEKKQENDGVYTLTVTIKDKVGHTATTKVVYTVNRFGSIYEYDDYLSSLVKDSGQYVQKVTDELIITEYNPDSLVEGSTVVEITKDGKPVDNPRYTITPEANKKVKKGNSGWFEYKYMISEQNFTSDGTYKISISSKDNTGNAPETENYKDKEMVFHVDSTAPEISSITGLEEEIINATNVTCNYTVYDTMGLQSVKVYVDGKVVQEVTDFDDINNFSGDFNISEKRSAQSVRVVVTDLAGNVTDTSSERFVSAYSFNKNVTVSTNTFVRFYANKKLFWGTVAGIVVLAILGILLAIAHKRKKEGHPIFKGRKKK